MKNWILLISIIFSTSLFSAPIVEFNSPKKAWETLTKHKVQISRRSAYIYLTSLPSEREKAWQWALESSDAVLKRDAIFSYFQLKGEVAAEKMVKMKPDKDIHVHETLQYVLRNIKSLKLRKQLASKMLKGKIVVPKGELYRKNIRLKDDPTYDHEVTTIKKISLANENWKFVTDKNNLGVKEKYFISNFKDIPWKKITVDKNWELQGFDKYDGYAWYRVTFKAPPRQNCNGAEFYFPMVDEEAWIWLNGIYLGQRANGADDWNKPFFMDASKEIRWGEINQLTIRVFDSTKAGGICKTPQLHLLK